MSKRIPPIFDLIDYAKCFCGVCNVEMKVAHSGRVTGYDAALRKMTCVQLRVKLEQLVLHRRSDEGHVKAEGGFVHSRCAAAQQKKEMDDLEESLKSHLVSVIVLFEGEEVEVLRPAFVERADVPRGMTTYTFVCRLNDLANEMNFENGFHYNWKSGVVKKAV